MSEALQTGLYLTVAGMGLVFLVLAILWGLMVLLLKLDKQVLPATPASGVLEEGGRGVTNEVAAIIANAIHTYETAKGKEVSEASFDLTNEEGASWLQAGRAVQQRDWQPRRWS